MGHRLPNPLLLSLRPTAHHAHTNRNRLLQRLLDYLATVDE